MKHLHLLIAVVTFSCVLVVIPESHAHHSFAMYDQSQVLTFTGRLTRFIPGANHAQLIFEVMDDDGSNMLMENGEKLMWGVETGPASRIARQGVTPDNFPDGTVIRVQLSPLRNGKTFGIMPNGAPLIHCGTAMPAGGCDETTGTVYLSENN